MRRLLNLVMTMVFVLSMGTHVFAKETSAMEVDEPTVSEAVYERGESYKEGMNLINQYSKRFFDNHELKKIFLDRAAQLQGDGTVIDYKGLSALYKEIIFEDRKTRVAAKPISVEKSVYAGACQV